MAYQPKYTITPRLLTLVEQIAALRERIQGASVAVSWIHALQKDTRIRNGHASTAIEGNLLNLEQVRALEEGRTLEASDRRSSREILNYFAGLRFIEKQSARKTIRHDEILQLHQLLADTVMDQGQAGRYRTIRVRVAGHVPPSAADVSGLMFELLEWWNKHSQEVSPVLSSAILHYRFEWIHPFADGNDRTGRALGLWELYRRSFDSHHIFSVDEYYWEDRPGYYKALDEVRLASEDLTGWLEYCAEGLRQTLERVWIRVQSYLATSPGKLVLRPRQEQLLKLLRDHGTMSPAELWKALGISRQGAMDLLKPLLEAGLVEKKPVNMPSNPIETGKPRYPSPPTGPKFIGTSARSCTQQRDSRQNHWFNERKCRGRCIALTRLTLKWV